MRIGPEPTTDKFIVIMNGEDDSMIPGRYYLMTQELNLGFFFKVSWAYRSSEHIASLAPA